MCSYLQQFWSTLQKKKPKLEELLLEGRKELAAAQIPSSQLEAELLLAQAIHKERLWLYKNPEYIACAKEVKAYWRYIRRRSLDEPQAYISSSREFLGYDFHVNPNVLIPRPESEELVELALRLPLPSKPAQVLDLCCGSGCIGLSLLLEKRNIYLHLSDISYKALKVCRKNARNLAPGRAFSYFKEQSYFYRVYPSDLFTKLPKQTYDLILSNPPYVLVDEYEQLPATLREYEPKEALLCSDPHNFYERLMSGLARHLKVKGYALIESSPRLIPLCEKLASQFSFSVELRKDLCGKERFLLLSKRS